MCNFGMNLEKFKPKGKTQNKKHKEESIELYIVKNKDSFLCLWYGSGIFLNRKDYYSFIAKQIVKKHI